MSRATYLEMMEQLGREPDLDKLPPDLEDFPPIVQEALVVFGILGDRVAADIGYLGKDYTLLPVYLPEENRELFLEVIAWMDAKVIKKSAEEMKKARDKIRTR
jgi:hypothetical protein